MPPLSNSPKGGVTWQLVLLRGVGVGSQGVHKAAEAPRIAASQTWRGWRRLFVEEVMSRKKPEYAIDTIWRVS